VCAHLAPVLAQIREEYPDEVRHVFRHNPLIGTPENIFHDKAALSAQAAEAAGKQGKFWEMHDLLFTEQRAWAGLSVDDFENWLYTKIADLELDEEKFKTDLHDEVNVARIQKTWDDNVAIGLTFTPLLLLNGQIWPNNLPTDHYNISAIIELTLLEERQYDECPPMQVDPLTQYIATLHTSKGDITLELFPEEAPLAVNSFVFLAREGWFDGVSFHRVLPGFVAQAGDPSGTGFGSPGYAFDVELSPDLKFDSPGVLAMANAGPGSNGSQFFITYGPTPQLDGGYTIFGKVISGMDVAESLTPRDPAMPGELPPGDVIISINIQEK
jgi:cyclophilin family peptidyl-prolyl cis-trans isomerase